MTPNLGQGAAQGIEDAYALRIGRVGQWQGPLACRLRDAILRAMPSRAVVKNVERLIAPGLVLAG
jgi:hypothetical protein